MTKIYLGATPTQCLLATDSYVEPVPVAGVLFRSAKGRAARLPSRVRWIRTTIKLAMLREKGLVL